MRRYHVLPFLLALIVLTIPLTLVSAQTSVSGDEICGATTTTKCTLKDVGAVTKGMLYLVIGVGLPLLVVFISYRFLVAWFAEAQGKSGALKEAREKAFNAFIGFMAIVALFGGLFYAMLQVVGVDSSILNVLKNLVSYGLFTPAYAANDYLPNFLGANSLYDVILSIVRLIMRFFVYPGLIVMWVWTGFMFVFAQGNPEGLSKAKNLLGKALLASLIIFTVQGFLVAAQGTVNKILPGATQNATTNPGGTTAGATGGTAAPSTSGTGDGRVAPTTGEPNSACTTSTGASGQLGVDKVCYAGRGAGSTNSASYCNDKVIGTMCDVALAGGATRKGTCSDNGSGKKECTVAIEGDACVSGGVSGSIDASGNCNLGQRPLTGKGGSCQTGYQCAGKLNCIRGTCQ